jgi:N-acetylneuraminate synthase
MDPISWREMHDRTRELENSLGIGIKKIEDNEIETAVLQRRSIRLRNNMTQGQIITRDDLEVLRPCPVDAIRPYKIKNVIGKKLRCSLSAGSHFSWSDLE